MSKKEIKILAFLLASGMFLTGCEINLKNIGHNSLDTLWPSSSTTGTTGKPPQDETEDIFSGIIVPPPDVTVPKEEATTPINPPITTIPEESTPPVIEETTAPIETIPPLNDNEEIKVHATTTVNIRASNTTDALKIGKLEVNEAAYRILSCSNNWDLVRTNDKIGYICRDYLSYSNDTQELEYKHQLKNDIVLTTSELNFRISPDSSSQKIDRFKKDTELEVVAEVDNGWLLVKYNGILGYVHKGYTTSLLEKAQQEYPELNLEELCTEKVVYSTTTLNIRNGDSTEYEQIGQLEKYETVRVLGEYDDWYFIMTNDYNFGFISKQYTADLDGVFIVVDKSEQQLYMYNGNELYFTTPVTTGKDTTPSDTGLFNIYSKETNRYLTDGKTYNSWVAYWMPYNGGEGLHDANWRSVFGTESYKTGGSHGCINIPPKIAGDIYNNASVGDKVLVHK